jgi:TolA-binding protein
MLLKEKLKKNLWLLILLVLLSFKSFSQNDTINQKIVLTKPVAKLVVKDLISGDQKAEELSAVNALLKETEFKLNTQSTLVINLQTQIKNYDQIVSELDGKFELQQKLSEDLELALKKQRRQTTIYKIGAGVGAVATVLLLIQ